MAPRPRVGMAMGPCCHLVRADDATALRFSEAIQAVNDGRLMLFNIIFRTGGQEIQSSTLELINGLVSLVLQSSMAEIADEVGHKRG